jgi:hypothetical protein
MDLAMVISSVSEMNKRGARREFLGELIRELEFETLQYHSKVGEGIPSRSSFLRAVVRWLLPTRNSSGQLIPQADLSPCTVAQNSEDVVSRDWVREWLWPRLRRALNDDEEEVEALMLRLAIRLLQKELTPAANALAARLL